MTKIGEKEEEIIALPWAALAGSTLTQEWPRRTRLRQDTLIAVPAFRLDGNRRWTAELRFEGRPQTAETLDRRGWGMRTFRDAPMGLDEVHLVVHYRRWQTRDKSQDFTSPLPEALTGRAAEGMKITPALVSFLQDVQGRLDIPEDLVARSLAYNRRYLKQIRRNRTPSQSTGDTASVHQTDQYILVRPEQMVEHLAMDEIALGGQYWTVLSSNDPGFNGTLGQRVIGLCRGRMVTDLLPPLRIVASWYRAWQPASPRPARITSDMWDAFWRAARSPEVFGNLVLFSTDPFHLQRHVHLAWEAAEETCIACCPDDAPCPRYRYNQEANALLNSIWEVSDNDQWEAFKLRWSTLRSRPGTEAWREPYARFDRMLASEVAGSRLRILDQTFGTARDGARPSNARAESANARIREVTKHLRFRSADGRLGRIMEQLHATPTIPEPKSVLLSPVLLRCLVCAGQATLPPRTTWQPVVTLPRGVTPLALQAPARLVCPTCGIQTASDPGPVTPEFIAWLRDPLQGQLNGVTLRRLTGLSARQLMEVRGRVDVPETPRSQRAVIYDEIWTSHRVWLVLATPEGDLLDLQLLEEPARPKDSRSGYRPGLHDMVAQAGVNLLLLHQPDEGYQQVQIRQEYDQLSRALNEVSWLGAKGRKGRRPFSLSPYVAHNLPTRAFKAVLKYLRSEGVVGKAVRDAIPLKDLFKAEPSKWKDPQHLTLWGSDVPVAGNGVFRS